MIKRIPVPDELVKLIKDYLSNHNLGNRGFEDGSPKKQEIGLIGELIVYHFLFGSYPDLNEKKNGYDGGFDILFCGKKIDVKTMERKSYVRPEYVNNFYIMQQDHDSDIIVFCSYHNIEKILEICGWIPKEELGTRGIYYAAGTKRIRADGTSFFFRQSNYEIENRDLNDISTLKNWSIKF